MQQTVDMDRKILVTGADGFIGRHLCPTLIQKGYSVRIAIRSKKRHGKYSNHHDVKVIGDIGVNTCWQECLAGIDTVIHLAGRAHVLRETAPNPEEIYQEINTKGTLRLAEEAARNGVQEFLFLSTIGIHGPDSTAGAITEKTRPAPYNAYTRSKWMAEQGLKELSQQTGLGVIVIRPPLVYGPGAGGNFSRLVSLVKSGIPLPFANVTNRRSMIGIDNLVDFILCTINSPVAVGQAFVIRDEELLTVPEICRAISKCMGKHSLLFPAYQPAIRALAVVLGLKNTYLKLTTSLEIDDHKVKALLDWSAPFSLWDQLEKAVSAVT